LAPIRSWLIKSHLANRASTFVAKLRAAASKKRVSRVISFPFSGEELRMTFSRRDFVKTSVLGAVAAGVGAQAQEKDASSSSQTRDAQGAARKRPIIVCANNGFNYLDDAFAFLKSGGDTLDAALRVVKGPETILMTTALGWAEFQMKRAWLSSTLAACTDQRGALDRWAACEILRMYRWFRRQ